VIDPSDRLCFRGRENDRFFAALLALPGHGRMNGVEKRVAHEGDAAMFKITLDASMCSKLNDVVQPVELCDPSGKVLGRFVPLIDPSEWEPVSSAASDAELDRREQANEKRYTTAEVLAYLEKL
jgi:hypothetical protein